MLAFLEPLEDYMDLSPLGASLARVHAISS